MHGELRSCTRSVVDVHPSRIRPRSGLNAMLDVVAVMHRGIPRMPSTVHDNPRRNHRIPPRPAYAGPEPPLHDKANGFQRQHLTGTAEVGRMEPASQDKPRIAIPVQHERDHLRHECHENIHLFPARTARQLI